MLQTLAIIICAVFLIAGLLGIVLPILPGVPLAWLGLFIYAFSTDFAEISVTVVVVFFVLMVLTLILDLFTPLLGAKQQKASKFGIIGASLGTIIGIFILGFWGLILGPLAGAFLGELIVKHKPKRALGSALGAFLGFIVGGLFKMVLVLTMAGFFINALI